jgi:hypothetical protein
MMELLRGDPIDAVCSTVPILSGECGRKYNVYSRNTDSWQVKGTVAEVEATVGDKYRTGNKHS